MIGQRGVASRPHTAKVPRRGTRVRLPPPLRVSSRVPFPRERGHVAFSFHTLRKRYRPASKVLCGAVGQMTAARTSVANMTSFATGRVERHAFGRFVYC